MHWIRGNSLAGIYDEAQKVEKDIKHCVSPQEVSKLVNTMPPFHLPAEQNLVIPRSLQREICRDALLDVLAPRELNTLVNKELRVWRVYGREVEDAGRAGVA